MNTPKHKPTVSKSKVGHQVSKHITENRVAIALLTISCILAIVFTVLPSLLITEIEREETNRFGLPVLGPETHSTGIWKLAVSVDGSDPVTGDFVCNETGDDDCVNDMSAKCNSNKAFSIMGILANLGALLLICFNMSNNIAYCLILFACVSYLIITALSMTYMFGDSNCPPLINSDFGPAFYLCVVCVLFTIIASFTVKSK